MNPTVTPDGSSIYVVAENSNHIVVIGTASKNILATIAVGTTPVQAAGSRAGLERDVSGALQVLGDGDLARLLRVGVTVGGVNLLQKFRSLVIGGAWLPKRADVNSVVEPKSIDTVVAEQQ